jgi:hypothetical protein
VNNSTQEVRGVTVQARDTEHYSRLQADIDNALSRLKQHIGDFGELERCFSRGEAQLREARAEFERLDSGFDAFLRSVSGILAEQQREAFAAWKAAKK